MSLRIVAQVTLRLVERRCSMACAALCLAAASSFWRAAADSAVSSRAAACSVARQMASSSSQFSCASQICMPTALLLAEDARADPAVSALASRSQAAQPWRRSDNCSVRTMQARPASRAGFTQRAADAASCLFISTLVFCSHRALYRPARPRAGCSMVSSCWRMFSSD